MKVDESESSSLSESEPSKTAAAESVPDAPPPSAIERVIHSRMAVLLLCFGVLGFFGVPLICVSRAFSQKEKYWWSAVVILYTLVLMAITAGCIWFAWRQWQEILS